MTFHPHSDICLPLALGGLLLVVNVGHTVFAEMAANPDGSFPFHESSAVLVAELGKMILALILLQRGYASSTDDDFAMTPMRFTPTRCIMLEMAVPGLLYTLSNVLSYTAIGMLGSTKYQLFSNMKIVITAITFRMVIQKRLKVIQWVCLLFLMTGLMVATTGQLKCDNSQEDSSEVDRSRMLWGFILMVVLSLASSVAGVFSELRLKGAPQHPMLQNALMYAWSCLICLTLFCYKIYTNENLIKGGTFFEGFSWPLWGAILTTAVYGQVIALVFYYCDNIVKVFANSATVIVSAMVDQVLFGKPLTVQVCIAACIIICSTIIYYGDSSQLLKEDAQFVKDQYEQRSQNCTGRSCSHGKKQVLYVGALCLMVASYSPFRTQVYQLMPQSNGKVSMIKAKAATQTGATGIRVAPTTAANNEPCDWPPSLYKPYTNANSAVNSNLVQAMREVKWFFDENPNTTFSYIDSGGALGLYRDGSLIPGDSDLDIRFGICQWCQPQPGPFPSLNNNFISANDFAHYGDIWTRHEIEVQSDVVHIQLVQRDLCLKEYWPGEFYWFHRSAMQRRAFQYTYGDFWFVRMPWKGVHDVENWYGYAQARKGLKSTNWVGKKWGLSLDIIEKMDINQDGNISDEELSAKVVADGIILDHFKTYITPRERCRAARQLTFLLKYQDKPFQIPRQTDCAFCTSNGDHKLFAFQECDGL